MPSTGWRVRSWRSVPRPAALSLAYVAAGLADAYAEDDIMYWDVAAGLALVQAAGGYVSCEDTRRLKWARRVRCAACPQIWGVA